MAWLYVVRISEGGTVFPAATTVPLKRSIIAPLLKSPGSTISTLTSGAEMVRSSLAIYSTAHYEEIDTSDNYMHVIAFASRLVDRVTAGEVMLPAESDFARTWSIRSMARSRTRSMYLWEESARDV